MALANRLLPVNVLFLDSCRSKGSPGETPRLRKFFQRTSPTGVDSARSNALSSFDSISIGRPAKRSAQRLWELRTRLVPLRAKSRRHAFSSCCELGSSRRISMRTESGTSFVFAMPIAALFLPRLSPEVNAELILAMNGCGALAYVL